jgi:hypothetical protein
VAVGRRGGARRSAKDAPAGRSSATFPSGPRRDDDSEWLGLVVYEAVGNDSHRQNRQRIDRDPQETVTLVPADKRARWSCFPRTVRQPLTVRLGTLPAGRTQRSSKARVV